ncbi:MAG: FtsX-like permease family protein [Rhodovibrionaceae bacterium]|nr:FtsX-like permease family protein [Rhodovibrionaceae bacterium]
MAENGGGRADLALSWRLARRELRGGLKGFRIFVGCLLLGVAAIAGVGSLSEAMLAGLRSDARALLGGEVEVRLIHRDATAEERAWIEANSARASRTAELRAMLRPAGEAASAERMLVELKAVDTAYPLYGAVETEPRGDLQELLDEKDGLWGALVDESVLSRMEAAPGDRVRLGDLTYEIRGTVVGEPDRATRAFTLGPRVMVSRASLDETGLVQPGSLIYHHYRVDLPPNADFGRWRAQINEAFPDAGWRVRGLDNAAPGIQRLVDRVGLFMTLVGLTALLVGGVGVANAVRSYLDEKRPVIATLKCLGAPARLVFQVYLLQVLTLAGFGILGGLALGAVTPTLAGPLLAEQLNFRIAGGVYPAPLILAAAFGLLTTLAFTLWPLARAQTIPAAALFRDVVERASSRLPFWAWMAIGGSIAALAALAVLSADDRVFALGFVGGAVATLALFRLAAAGIEKLAARLPRPRLPGLRLALANLHRPGAATGSVVTSLGLGLTVLVAIALIRGNLDRQVMQTMPEDAPGFYFIDIQPQQVEPFLELVRGHPGVEEVRSVPMLRGRITKVNGTRPEDMTIPEDVAWVFRGDRGLTWTRAAPDGTEITRGQWWPQDYGGEVQLVSLDAEVGRALGLKVGDSLTVNVLGRELTAEIANFRRIEWQDLTINFVMVFSPGLLQQAPQTHLATVKMDPAEELALQQKVTEAFPNVSAIRVKEALERFAGILQNITVAVTATAGVTLIAGILVLAGAVAAGHHRRIYDAVVLKVLGATRRNVGRAFLLEYGLMGLITAAIAAGAGTLAAWVVLTQVMQAEFAFLPLHVTATALVAAALTLAFGFFGTWQALAEKAAPHLRNE